MKMDRLYGLTVFLLNHGKTSAKELARRFEVSVRTIQRDLDALCQAGIPVVTLPGANGGCMIAEEFRMNQLATKQDYGFILAALRGLVSATGDGRASATLEKVGAMTDGDPGLILDFSVLRERGEEPFRTLQRAIEARQTVRFDYTNADREHRLHIVEPVALVYRWYAWYLLAFSRVKQDYRTYKLVRMENVRPAGENWSCPHGPAEAILQRLDGRDSRRYMEIEVRCAPEARALAGEYLKGTVEDTFENGDLRMRLRVVENEQLWFGTLLSMGDKLEILAPEALRNRVLQAAENLVRLYRKHDI